MKKNYLFMGLMVMGLGITATSCSDDDDDSAVEQAQNLDYTSENADAWGNYAYNVATLLATDANTLYESWNTSYNGGEAFAKQFKNHTAESGYTSAESCIEQILDGCIDIANEVGTAKIGTPYDLYKKGSTTEALYSVESWYSWHSRDDYKNNIKSIANSLLSYRIEGDLSDFNYKSKEVSASCTNSIMVQAMMGFMDNTDEGKALGKAAADAWTATVDAWNAIEDIPQPFRNNIASSETKKAMEACDALVHELDTLKGVISTFTEDQCQNIVNQYVDDVVIPTYSDLAAKNKALQSAVKALKDNPTNDTFSAAAEAWLEARAPWETSESFLFGPVDALGLDPNMDSWPLDAVGIANLLKSQNWAAFQWSEGDEDEAVEAAQSLRGFHTLEYLIFKDGKARTVK
ncbi:MAG: peptidase M75 [Bacteroidaceae bacterium]|nr:peptidase M75 [Bacteroidaceae bacterium]